MNGAFSRGVFFRAPVVLILAAGLAAFGAPQGQKQRPLRHDTAAVVKLVPVRILDAEGRPVRRLTKADFSLTDNGEPRVITEFEVHESEGRGLSPEAPRTEVEAVPAESSRRIFFVLDMQGSDLFGNRDAKNAVLAYVKDNLSPGDEASVMTFGATTGLVLKQYLTSDLARIENAIKRSVEMPGGGALPALPTLARDVADAPQEKPIAFHDKTQTIESDPAGSERRVSETMPFGYEEEGLSIDVPPGRPPGSDRTKADFDRSMSELATAMKFIPGSKSVVYFSMRVPGPEVGRLFAEANATVFAVNTNSVRPDGPALTRKLKEQQGETLRAFSESSGGRYFADVRDARKLAAELEVLSGNYYVLGYYVNPSWDGRLHRIEVTVGRSDLKVLAQAGYSDAKPFAAFTDLEKKLQLFDLLLSDEPVGTEALDLPMRVLHGSVTEAANAAVLLKLAVDERTGVPPGTADLYVLVFDGEHKIVLAERAELDTRAMARRTLYPYLLTKLPPGDYECRVAARDKETGYAVTSRAAFAVPTPAEPRKCSLSSPLILVPSEKVEFARLSRPLKKGQKPLTLLGFYPYLPVRCAPLLEDLPADVQQVRVLLPLKTGAGQVDETDLKFRLLGAADRKEIPVDWKILDAQRLEPDLAFFLVGINVRGLDPGRFLLDFQISGPGPGAGASVTAPLVRR